MNKRSQLRTCLLITLAALATCSAAAAQPQIAKQQARRILAKCNLKGSMIIHVGCGQGDLTAALRANDRCLVRGLDRSASYVALARKNIRSLGVYGTVSIEKLDGAALPYIDNLLNLVVCGNIEKGHENV